MLVVTPYYNKPTQEGLFRHFKAINDAVDIPIVIYNIPGRSVVDMGVETMARCFDLKNVVGVKDATANLARPAAARGHAARSSFCSRARTPPRWASWRMAARLHLGDLQCRAAFCSDFRTRASRAITARSTFRIG